MNLKRDFISAEKYVWFTKVEYLVICVLEYRNQAIELSHSNQELLKIKLKVLKRITENRRLTAAQQDNYQMQLLQDRICLVFSKTKKYKPYHNL